MPNKNPNPKPAYVPRKPHVSSWPLTICEYCHAEYRVEPGRAQGVKRQCFYSASCRSGALARARWPN